MQQNTTDFVTAAELRMRISAVLKSVAKELGRPVLKRLNSIEEKQNTVADVVAALQEQVRHLRSQLDKQQQALSANQKHCQALEKKIGAR